MRLANAPADARARRGVRDHRPRAHSILAGARHGFGGVAQGVHAGGRRGGRRQSHRQLGQEDRHRIDEPQPARADVLRERLADLQSETELGYDVEAALAEAGRCLSCGSCFGCERCWMYCTPGCMSRLPSVAPGHYFTINHDKCDGCRKCAEECPTGFLDMV